MPFGKKLIHDIDAYHPKTREFAFWWMGQHSFVVKTKSAVIYIDPFLSNHPRRAIAPMLKPDELTNADFILGTHDHSDHIDRPVWPALAQASPDAVFVAPGILLNRLSKDLKMPNSRFAGADDGKTIKIKGVNITGIAAAHELLAPDTKTGRYSFLGYVVEVDGVAIYHSGDCCIYEGLQTKLKRWKFDAVFLPINGRDAKRLKSGCIGNMTYQEAADLAGALKPRLTIPAHFDMFPGNQENPELFADYMAVKYPKLNVKIPNYGIRMN